MKRGKKGTLVEVLVVAAVVAALPSLLWCSMLRARDAARRAACLNNLKQVITGIKTYSPDYDEYYPTSAPPGKEIKVETHYRDLGILYPIYVTSLDVFTCPSSGDRMPRGRADDSLNMKAFPDREAEQVSYAYSYDGSGGKNLPWTEAAAKANVALLIRPSAWDKVKGDFQFAWAASAKEACLSNLDELQVIFKYFSDTGMPVEKAAEKADGTRYFCPDDGEYRYDSGKSVVSCSLHGTAESPRQPDRIREDTAFSRLINGIQEIAVSLAFEAEGIRTRVHMKFKDTYRPFGL